MNSSTSSEELPRAIVWISTRGGANSGKTSTFALGTWERPKAIAAAAPNSTSHRNRRLLETTQRITWRGPPARSRRPRRPRSSRRGCRARGRATGARARPRPERRGPSPSRSAGRCGLVYDVGLALGVVEERRVRNRHAPAVSLARSRCGARSASAALGGEFDVRIRGASTARTPSRTRIRPRCSPPLRSGTSAASDDAARHAVPCQLRQTAGARSTGSSAGATSAHRCISSSSGESVGSWPPKRR